MHSDRIPTVRTPLCLLIGQPDGQLSSRRGPDISVSNQISPSESLFMCVCPCVCAEGRERKCTVPSDCWEHMCWRWPECVLKWRLMNKRPECCVWTRLKGQWTCVKECTNLSLCLPTVCACAGLCVCLCICVPRCTVSFKLSSSLVSQLWDAVWHERNSQSFTITARSIQQVQNV